VPQGDADDELGGCAVSHRLQRVEERAGTTAARELEQRRDPPGLGFLG
jgi:hypothetical protein